MWKVLLASLIVVLIIVLCVYLYDEYYRESAKDKINKSGGTMSRMAEEALNSLQRLHMPQPNDHFAQAEILRYNMLNNDHVDMALHVPILHMILNEYMAGLEQYRARPNPNDQIPFMLDRIEGMDYPFFIMVPFGQVTPEVRAANLEARQEEALAEAPNRIEAIQTFFTNSIRHTNDHQNVHDNKVSSDLRNILEIIQCPVDISDMFSDANIYLDQKPNKLAIDTLRKMADGTYISTLDIREDELFALVWNRTLHPSNELNKDNMQEAVYLALCDCWEHGSLVCINGRCGKVLGALALIDYNPDVKVMTHESYRNQIYHETLKIIDSEIEEAMASNDREMKQAAESYYDPSVEPNEKIDELKNKIRMRIDANIEKYDIFNEDEKTNLKTECYISAIL